MQIGEIVSTLIDQSGLSLEGVAERVRAQGATNVRYQHIQQLLEFPSRRPRYLPELAAAFGLTVEEFLAWKPRQTFAGLTELGDPALPSQAGGITGPILASATKLVRMACENLDIGFDPEDEADANIVLLACSYLLTREQQAVTPDNLVDFTKYMRGRMKGTEGNERVEGTRSVGQRAVRQG